MATQPDIPDLRHPLERPVFYTYVASNLVVMVAAIFISIEGSNWLGDHPFIRKHSTKIRAGATALVLALPALTFLRNTRRANVRGNSIVVSATQFPQLNEILLHHCRKLNMEPPELYLSDLAIEEPSQAYSTWSKQYILIGSKFLQPSLEPVLPLFSFMIGSELGRLRLGHSGFVTELLLAYVVKIPYLKNPLLHVFALSEDRYGAYLAPDGLPFLVGMASGRLMLPFVNIPEHIAQISHYRGLWAIIAELASAPPVLAVRLRELYRAGFFGADAAANAQSVFHPKNDSPAVK